MNEKPFRISTFIAIILQKKKNKQKNRI